MVSLMTLMQLVISLITISFAKSIWQIKILGDSSIQTMEKGKFYEITVLFSNANPPTFPTVSFTVNNPNLFKLNENSYSLDLAREDRQVVMIGVSCDTTLTEATLSFTVQSTDFNSLEYSIKIRDPVPTVLTLKISSNAISKGEYGIVFLNPFPMNIDPLEIELKSTNQLITLENYIIPTYNAKILRNKIYAKYSLKSEGTSIEPTITVKANLKSANKCYILSSNEFTVSIGENTIKDTKGQMIGFQINPSAGISYLELTMDKYISPSMAYCVLISSKLEFPTKTAIINQDFEHKHDDATTRYFKTFLSSSMPSPRFSFDSLDKFEAYKLRCIYENSANDQKLLTSSTFSSSKPISIAPIPSPESYCAIWFLKKQEDKQFIETALMNYCQSILITKIPLSESGCLQCTKRSLDNILNAEDITLATSICLTTTRTCTSKNNKQDTHVYADTVLFQFKTSQGIYDVFSTRIDFAKPVITEDFSQTAQTDFITSKPIHKKDLYGFSFSHKNGIPHECAIEMKCENPHVTNLPKQSFILKAMETKKLSFIIPSKDYDDNNYSFQITCKPMPNISSHSFQSSFTEQSFSHLKQTSCEGKTELPECYKITHQAIPSMLTENPMQDLSDLIKSFNEMDFNDIEDSLKAFLTEYLKLTDEFRQLNTTVMLGELMSHIDCIATQYTACRKLKSDIMKELITFLSTKYSNGIIPEQLPPTLTNKETMRVHKSKLILMAMYYATSNIDAYTNTTSRDVLNYTAVILLEAINLMDIVNKELTGIKASDNYITNVNLDLINLYTAIIDNAINLTDYMQRDKYLNTNTSNNGLLYSDAALLNFSNSILNATKGIDKYQPLLRVINATNYDITINPLPVRSTSKESIQDFIVNGTHATISIPVNGLFLSLQAKTISVIYYKKSPLIGLNSTNLYSKPVVNVKMFNNNYNDINLGTIEYFPITIKFDVDPMDKDKDKAYYCYFIRNFALNAEEMITDQKNLNVPSCEMTKIYGDILVGTPNIGGEVSFFFDTWMIVLGVIVLCVLATILIYVVVFVCQGKKKAENLIEINQQNKYAPLFNDENSLHSGN